MSPLNLTFSPSPTRRCISPQLTPMMVLVLTSLPMVFGEAPLNAPFFDVRIFNPLAPSNIHSNSASSYRKHEREKKRAYAQRVQQIEHSSFTPLVLSATGGFGSEVKVFYKRLASLLAEKWDQQYSSTARWLRCRLSFSLLRSAIRTLRGSRSSHGHPIKSPIMADLVTSESRII